MKGKIIVLEGPDCSGKSTLANNLISKINGIYIHNTYYKGMDVPYEHLHRFDIALQLSKQGINCFIDRMWLSELVYSKIYRDSKTEYKHNDIMFMNSKTDMTIICLPSKQKYINLFEKKKLERNEMFKDNMNRIYDEYDKFLLGTSEFEKFKINDKYMKYDFMQTNEDDLLNKLKEILDTNDRS